MGHNNSFTQRRGGSAAQRIRQKILLSLFSPRSPSLRDYFLASGLASFASLRETLTAKRAQPPNLGTLWTLASVFPLRAQAVRLA